MVKKPLVSVIVSTYNSERFIERKILDLLQQSINDQIEIIIINSGSEQDEDSIIYKYCELYDNIRYIKTNNRETIYKAWNRGIRIAKGKYITNANTDDLLRSDALEILSNKLDSDITIGLVYGDQYITHTIDTSFKEARFLERVYKLDYSPFRLLWKNIVGSQPMWRASIHFDNNIWFNENFEVSGDSEFEFRVSQKYKLQRLPKVLGIYYKSLNDENKEFQDRELTKRESLSVKEKSARSYIEGLERNELNMMKWKILFNMLLPRIIYSSFRIIIEKFKPYKQVPPRIFWYWFASLYYEYKGNLQKAQRYCEKYFHSSDNHLILRQYERLKSLKV
ncbi:MAG: glycosyltransferase [Ignavibacteria bacterium]|nr:glycosyltransferase [Ignavibacteria bacterium]